MPSITQVFIFGMIFSAATIIGYDSGYLNGVLGSDDFIRRYGVTEDDGDTMYLRPRTRSLFSSLIVVGTILGCIANSLLPEKTGYRGKLLVASISYAIGVILQVLGLAPAVFIVGRILLGSALGFISILIPAYLMECSNANNRGMLIAAYLQLLTSGNVMACGINLGTEKYNDSRSWCVTIGFQLLFALVIFVGAIFCPESPTILLKNRESAKARQAIAALKNLNPDSEAVSLAINDINEELAKQASFGDIRTIECFQGTNLRRTMLGIAMSFFTIATGITFWFGYGTTFFIAAGVNNAYLISLVLAITNCIFTAPSIYLIERLGRRACLIYGGLIMILTQILSAVIHSASPNSSASKNMLIAGAIIFIAAYAPTWGIGGWVLMTEPFSHRLRAKQTTIVMIFYWTITWLVGFVTPYMVDATAGDLGINVCYLWASTGILSVLWAYFCVPELAGLSIEEMNDLFAQKVPAWGSVQWQRQLREISGVSESSEPDVEKDGPTIAVSAKE